MSEDTRALAQCVDEAALEAATKRIYEDKGDRKGIFYAGWDYEPEDVKRPWREDVRVTIEAYLAAVRTPAACESQNRALHDLANVALEAVAHVGLANYREREEEANRWITDKLRELTDGGSND